MKKLLGLFTIGLVCLMTACSWMYTLDVEGKTTITVDRCIEVTVSDYEYSSLVSTVTVKFTNTSSDSIEFDVEDAKCSNGENDKSVIATPTLTSTAELLNGKLSAEKSVEYTFLVTFIDGENADDYKISFELNDTELFVQLKVK